MDNGREELMISGKLLYPIPKTTFFCWLNDALIASWLPRMWQRGARGFP